MSEVKIKVLKGGPLLVEGIVELKDSDGNVVPVTKQPFALCRCGASGSKPFCDGTHSKVCFETEKAVAPE